MTSFFDIHDTEHPDTLHLACSDGPVVVHTAKTAVRGELLTVRNMGNVVPTDPADASVDAVLDYAVNQRHVRSIVVCGHSNCGAMKTLLSESIDTPTSPVCRWLDYARETLIAYRDHHVARVGAAASGFDNADQLAVVNVAIQVERLVRHPILVAATVSGRLHVSGTFYSESDARLYAVSTNGLPAPQGG
ncbi:carbonic anhydrase [Mycobacterium sp. CBMA271]|uniref:carbonic anhydrase n=1 Tax=unclassified Mycobacteroides TaxID=2618759 RepID=UPI0012DBFBFE|nr:MULTISPECIES: carbonic anhydrase [unclassified Mycobacteroides]MUM18604.1 carbonic anhydrase [Mycobacteroides sp. CBMA 326]MUM22566.1 carbonic anhydrase [Mycobacteroides sp. CBMA 271]